MSSTAQMIMGEDLGVGIDHSAAWNGVNTVETKEESLCFSCHLIGKYTDLVSGYVGEVSSILSPIMLDLFNVTVPFWIIISLILIQIKTQTWSTFFLHLFFTFITYSVFIINQKDLIHFIYLTSLEIMGQTATLALLGGVDLQVYTTQSYASSGMVNLVYTVEEAIEPIFLLAWELLRMTNKFGVPVFGAFIGLCLIIPYFFVLTVYFSKVVVAIFRVMILAMFAPIIIYFSAFTYGREMWKAALKTILASIMILLACTAAISMLMYGAQGLVDDLNPHSHTGKEDFFSKNKLDIFLLILLGLMGTAFMAEANGIANSLAGSVLTNAAVAIITGGVAGGAAAASKFLGGKASSSASSLLPAGSDIRSKALNIAALASAGPVAMPMMAGKAILNKAASLKSQAG